MRVAALYDIHGNRHALEAVLEDVEGLAVDLILVGGDVAWGAFPRETLDMLQRLGDRAKFIRGNADREVAGRIGISEGMIPAVADVTAWCADQLRTGQDDVLMSWPETLVIDVDGLGPTLFCHGSPRSDKENITPASPEARLRGVLQGVEQPAVVCGHTHMQFDRRVDRWRVVNAGSVGMPYEGSRGARWALLGPDVELRSTSYDVEGAAEAMRATSCPHVEEMFVSVILSPASRAEATAAFESDFTGDAPAEVESESE